MRLYDFGVTCLLIAAAAAAVALVVTAQVA